MIVQRPLVDPSDYRRAPARHRSPARRRRQPTHRQRLVRTVAVATGVFLLLGVGVAAAGYRRLNGNINSEDIFGKLGDRPAEEVFASGRPLNILLVGSDSRAGDNAQYGRGIQGARSDTTMLLHISRDRKRAYAVSIPRDSWLEIPACDLGNSRTSRAHDNRFNEAYSIGGTACTVKTVEQNTHIRIDHVIVIDFGGFTRMVHALGKVAVCLPRPVHDRRAKLELPAGRQEVDGRQALGFVRMRKGIGDGSDLSRIKRQQSFLSAVAQKATSTGLLLNPPRLFSFLDATTKSISTDPQLANLNELRKLAQSLKGIGLANVEFVTVPVVDRPDGATVEWRADQADPLWEAVHSDEPLPGEAPAAARKRGTSADHDTVRVPPSKVRVRVLNGTGAQGAARRAAGELAALGFKVVEIGNARGGPFDRSVVRHNAAYNESGRTLATAVVGSVTEADAGLGPTLELIVGRNWTGVQGVRIATAAAAKRPPMPTPTLSARTAAKDVCR